MKDNMTSNYTWLLQTGPWEPTPQKASSTRSAPLLLAEYLLFFFLFLLFTTVVGHVGARYPSPYRIIWISPIVFDARKKSVLECTPPLLLIMLFRRDVVVFCQTGWWCIYVCRWVPLVCVWKIDPDRQVMVGVGGGGGGVRGCPHPPSAGDYIEVRLERRKIKTGAPTLRLADRENV